MTPIEWLLGIAATVSSTVMVMVGKGLLTATRQVRDNQLKLSFHEEECEKRYRHIGESYKEYRITQDQRHRENLDRFKDVTTDIKKVNDHVMAMDGKLDVLIKKA